MVIMYEHVGVVVLEKHLSILAETLPGRGLEYFFRPKIVIPRVLV